MTKQDIINFERALEKLGTLTTEYMQAASSGALSPYHLKEKSKALTKQQDKVTRLKERLPAEWLDEAEAGMPDLIMYEEKMIRRIPKHLCTELKFIDHKDGNIQLWSNPPDQLGKGNRMPFMVFKPLEFREEWEKIIKYSDQGMQVWEEVK